MARIGLAFKAFFRILGDRAFAEQVGRLAQKPASIVAPVESPTVAAPTGVVPPARPAGRSDALNLLAALQREARFVDFVKEPIDAFSDAQVGAAVRDVHKGCSAVLERMLSLRPVLDQAEGTEASIPAGFDAGRVRLIGNVSGAGPFRGPVQHAGWQATRMELPEWNGSEAVSRIVVPAEVEVK